MFWCSSIKQADAQSVKNRLLYHWNRLARGSRTLIFRRRMRYSSFPRRDNKDTRDKRATRLSRSEHDSQSLHDVQHRSDRCMHHCEIVRSLLFINYYVKTLSSNESSVTISISLSDLYPWRSMERYQCHWTVSHFHSNYSPCSWLCCVKFKINPIIRRILLDLRLSSFRLLFGTIQLFYFFTIPLLFHAIQLCIPWRNDF